MWASTLFSPCLHPKLCSLYVKLCKSPCQCRVHIGLYTISSRWGLHRGCCIMKGVTEQCIARLCLTFGIYRLYYKLLAKFSDKEGPKSDYHNIVHGPRSIQFNWNLLHHLIDVIYVQIRDIYHMVSSKCILDVQDYSTMVAVKVNKAIETFLDFNDAFFGDFLNCRPIHLSWM